MLTSRFTGRSCIPCAGSGFDRSRYSASGNGSPGRFSRFPGPGLAAPRSAVKRDEIGLLRVGIVLEFLEQLLRDLILAVGLIVVVLGVHYSDNSKACPPTSRRRPYARVACYNLGKKQIPIMISSIRSILQSIESPSAEFTDHEQQALQLLLSGEPLQSAATPAALLLTQQEVAQQLKMCRSTVWRLTRQGIFHPVEITPGTWRYRTTEIEAFAREGRPRRKDPRNARSQPCKVAS